MVVHNRDQSQSLLLQWFCRELGSWTELPFQWKSYVKAHQIYMAHSVSYCVFYELPFDVVCVVTVDKSYTLMRNGRNIVTFVSLALDCKRYLFFN